MLFEGFASVRLMLRRKIKMARLLSLAEWPPKNG